MNLFGEEFAPIEKKKTKKNNPKSNNSKNIILPHTQAKLNLYKDYLEAYLAVLLNSDATSKIYLFDIFCGNGIYEDGKPGSPVIAIEIIKKSVAKIKDSGKKCKPIYLIINDINKKRLNKVTEILNDLNDGSCIIQHYNFDAEEMLQTAISRLKKNDSKAKSLIFIDPYGYSKIRKSIISELMSFKNSEILLFLPIAQMHRFSEAAQRLVDHSSFEPLRKFINEFLPEYDFKDELDNRNSVFSFINAIKDAFTFQDKYYSCSHYIQRDVQKNYYALFFITSHIYGLHKMLEAKWKEDKVSGDGFRIENDKSLTQMSLFDDHEKNIDNEFHRNYIKDSFCRFLNGKAVISNREVYTFILKLGYLPPKINPLLKLMYKEEIIDMIYMNPSKLKTLPTYVSYNDYKDYNIKVHYKLKQKWHNQVLNGQK